MTRLTKKQGQFLLKLARNAIETYLTERKVIAPPKAEASLRESRGVFVTLKSYPHNVLRGCIGLPYPTKPLVEAVIDSAVSSATADPRFKSMEEGELKNTLIELTILTQPVELKEKRTAAPSKIQIGKHGLIIRTSLTSGLLLPQVAVEHGPWTPTEFLEAVCWKAGLPPQAWKNNETQLFTFEGQIFKEVKPGAAG